MAPSEIMLLKTITHYFLHFVFPLFIALIFYRKNWKKRILFYWQQCW
jgi:hypothetical protein